MQEGGVPNINHKEVLFHRLLRECEKMEPGGMLSYTLRYALEQFPRDFRRDIVNKIHMKHSLFCYACMRGLAGVVEYMIVECSANIEQKGSTQAISDRFTPLWGAANAGQIRVVKILLKYGADINALSEEEGVTPVLSACCRNQNDVVKYLTEHGADINRSDLEGYTCLMRSLDNSSLFKLLLENGADVNAVDQKNRTCLYHAVNSSNDTMDLMVKYGVNPYICCIHGDDALLHACVKGRMGKFEYFTRTFEYPPEKIAQAHEIIGMLYYGHQNGSPEVALAHWKAALAVRIEHGLLPKTPIMPLVDTYQFTKEFESKQELYAISLDPVQQQIQSLLVTERILGPHHEESFHMRLFVGSIIHFQGYPGHSLNIQLRSLKLAIDKFALFAKEDIASKIYHLLGHVLSHYKELPKSAVNDWEKLHAIVSIFKITTENIVEIRKLLTIQPAWDKQAMCFDIVMRHVVYMIYIMLEIVATVGNRYDVLDWIAKFLKKNVTTFVTDDTSLHLFLTLKELKTCTNKNVLKLLLNCGADINAKNKDGCSPLFIAMLPENYLDWVVIQLMENGAHVDQPNSADITPLDLIRQMNQICGTDIKVNDHVSLKCLSARVVVRNKIPYRCLLPESVREWVALHDSEHLSMDDHMAYLCSKFVSLRST